jgi:Proteins involved in synaptic transmission and general secretion, Sec1 family
MCRMARERQDIEKPGNVPQSQIDHLLLLDRGVDLLTPLATQLTYEGLIDEIFGISNSEYMTIGFQFKLVIKHAVRLSDYCM